MDFIYNGETNIYQEDLDGFLAIAEGLQLKGMVGSQEPALDDPKTKYKQNNVQREPIIKLEKNTNQNQIRN